jgi:hypothetical protein
MLVISIFAFWSFPTHYGNSTWGGTPSSHQWLRIWWAHPWIRTLHLVSPIDRNWMELHFQAFQELIWSFTWDFIKNSTAFKNLLRPCMLFKNLINMDGWLRNVFYILYVNAVFFSSFCIFLFPCLLWESQVINWLSFFMRIYHFLNHKFFHSNGNCSLTLVLL